MNILIYNLVEFKVYKMLADNIFSDCNFVTKIHTNFDNFDKNRCKSLLELEIIKYDNLNLNDIFQYVIQHNINVILCNNLPFYKEDDFDKIKEKCLVISIAEIRHFDCIKLLSEKIKSIPVSENYAIKLNTENVTLLSVTKNIENIENVFVEYINNVQDILYNGLNVYFYWGQGINYMPEMLRYIYYHNIRISKKYKFNIILLTDNNIRDYIVLHDRFETLTYALKSDIIKFYILHKYGGIWLDTHSIITGDLNKLMNCLISSGKEIMIENVYSDIGFASICMIGSSKTSAFCYNYINNKLNENKDLNWTDTDPMTVTKLYKQYPENVVLKKYNNTKNGCNYLTLNEDPGINKEKWIFNDVISALSAANKLLNNRDCYYVFTWTIYSKNNINENLCDFVFNNKNSIFYHLCIRDKWNFIDKIMYINLEESVDRNNSIKQILCDIPNDKIIRFNAIKDTKGYIGCSKSHIECLNIAKANNWHNVMIIEDDMIWNETVNIGYNTLNNLINNPYDVILLGGTSIKINKLTHRLYEGQTATGYIVSRDYYDTLLSNFKEGLNNLLNTDIYSSYAIDQYWKILQKTDNWYYSYPGLIQQSVSYSTIENRIVDYSSFFKDITFINDNINDNLHIIDVNNRTLPTFNILIATIGRPSLQNLLDSLFSQLSVNDCITIVFDGITKEMVLQYNYSKAICKINIYYESIQLGYWGHGARNKYAKLLETRDFILHADDDDTYSTNIFDSLRKTCIKDTLYIALMKCLFAGIFPKNFNIKTIKVGNIGTPCGIIPYELNKKCIWHYVYGGDGLFYEELINKTDKIELLPIIIYKIRH